MLENFSFTQFLVTDALVAGGVIATSFLFFYTVGRYSFVPMLTALYIGAAFALLGTYQNILPVIGAYPVYQQSVIVFGVVSIVAFLIFRKHLFFDPVVVPSGIETAACALMIGGFILAVVGCFLPQEIVATLLPNIRMIFVTPLSQTLWFLAPIAVLLVLRAK